jgi:hypothetical protein
MKCIAKSVEAYLHQNVKDATIRIMPFTTAVVAVYMDEKKIQEHCDQRWSAGGKFMENQNSQVEGTATVVFVIGGGRSLDFKMYGHDGTKQTEVGIKGRFQLEHGSLFILEPSDERPTARSNFDRYSYTFYKHSSDGVEGRDLEMSIGIVFRTTNHLVEVYRDTGLAVLDKELQLNMFRVDNESNKIKIPKKPRTKEMVKAEREELAKRNSMLKAYMKGQVHPSNARGAKNQRVINEEHFKKVWEKCKETYLPICSVAERDYIDMITDADMLYD